VGVSLPVRIANGADRTLYFSGRLLTAADFEREQEYFDHRSERLCRFVLGWGVAVGLKVSLGSAPGVLRVSAGFGLTPLGREVYLPGAIEFAAGMSPPQRGWLIARPAPLADAPTPVPDLDSDFAAPTVLRGGVSIEYLQRLCHPHDGTIVGDTARGWGPEMPDELPHAANFVVLAQVKAKKDGLAISPKGRRLIGSRDGR